MDVHRARVWCCDMHVRPGARLGTRWRMQITISHFRFRDLGQLAIKLQVYLGAARTD